SPRKRQTRTVSALHADGTLASDRTCLDHIAVAGGHEQRDHAGPRKVDLIDRITRAVTYHSLRQGTLPLVWHQQRNRVLRQGGEQAISNVLVGHAGRVSRRACHRNGPRRREAATVHRGLPLRATPFLLIFAGAWSISPDRLARLDAVLPPAWGPWLW